jgi:hypothetical protein
VGLAAQCAQFGFQTESSLFQTDSNLAQTLTNTQGVFPLLKKLEVKYGWKDLEISTNFSYRNFSRLEKEFELKFREFL